MANEKELQMPEYAGPGPVRIRSTSMAHDPIAALTKRIEVLESQVASLQSAAPKGIPG